MAKKTKEQFINELADKYKINKSSFSVLTDYLGWDKPITIKCNICGSVSTTAATDFLKKRRKNICKCYGYSREWHLLREQFINWKKS